MATVEREPRVGGDQIITVENPATGAVVGEVPVLSADEVRALAERGRAAQPAWEALGFEGRARVLRRAQKWVLDNQQRVIDTIVSETGKTHEDALLAEIGYVGNAFGFWAKNAADYLADEKIRSANPFVLGRKLVVRYAPLGLVGVIGPWNYPLSNSFGDCIPALAAGNAVILKPSEVTPLSSLLMAEAMRECGLPEGVYQVATGLGETGPGADRRGRHGDVHRLDGDRPQGDGARRAHAHAGVAGARRQGPDDRAGRRRRRARGQRRHLLLDAERRADLHLGRARLRRGADLRRVRRQGHREGQGAAPGRAGGAGQRGRRRGHVRQAARHRLRPRRRRARGRRDRASPAGTRAPTAGASTSRPCSWASTTRWRA